MDFWRTPVALHVLSSEFRTPHTQPDIVISILLPPPGRAHGAAAECEVDAPPDWFASLRGRIGRFLFCLAVLLLVLLRPALAQFTACPFPDDAAVPDTLDPTGYYPLQLENAWEYVRWGGCCLDRASRHEVIGDTLIDEQPYRIVRIQNALFDGSSGDPRDASAVTEREEIRRFVSIVDGDLIEWEPHVGADFKRDLGQAFQSCETDPDTGVMTVVWALADAAYELNKQSFVFYEPPAGKGMDVAGEQFLYQYGLGYVSGEAGDSIEVLTFARVNELEFGRPLDELFGAFREPLPSQPEVPEILSFSLVNYPNPFAERTSFEIELPRKGTVSLQIIDLLGRRVGLPIDGKSLDAGKHALHWEASRLSSGIYFVQLIHDGKLVDTRSIVIAR